MEWFDWAGFVKIFSQLAPIVTTISVPTASAFFFVKRWHDKNVSRQMVSRNLLRELEDAMSALDAGPNSSYFVTVHIGNSTYQYMKRLLNHDFYDSMMFSGQIGDLWDALQQRIQDIFHMIKEHNHLLIEIRQLNEDGKFRRIPARQMRLDAIERELLACMPAMIGLLRKEAEAWVVWRRGTGSAS